MISSLTWLFILVTWSYHMRLVKFPPMLQLSRHDCTATKLHLFSSSDRRNEAFSSGWFFQAAAKYQESYFFKSTIFAKIVVECPREAVMVPPSSVGRSKILLPALQLDERWFLERAANFVTLWDPMEIAAWARRLKKTDLWWVKRCQSNLDWNIRTAKETHSHLNGMPRVQNPAAKHSHQEGRDELNIVLNS